MKFGSLFSGIEAASVAFKHLGWEAACAKEPSLAKGLNIVNGKCVYDEIIEAFDWKDNAKSKT